MEIIRDICKSQPGPMVLENVTAKEIVTYSTSKNVTKESSCSIS